MKKIILLCFILINWILLFSQAPDWEWVFQAGGNGRDYALDIATDEMGNSYIVGCFEDTLFYSLGSLVSDGFSDLFVAKLDLNGNLVWISQAGGVGIDSGISIVIDDLGNSYITGYFYETAFFNSYSVSSISAGDVFVAKLDTEGNWQWVTSAGGYGMCTAMSITIDGLNNIYITGRYLDSITFGPYTLPNSSTGYSYDIFVAKLNSSGNWLWAIHAEGVSNDYGNAISIGTEGNVLLTGSFELTSTFGAFELQSLGEGDIYVAKISSEGIWQWAVQAGGESNDMGLDITISDSNIIGIIGRFINSATFGNEVVTGLGDTDIFVSTLDSDGNWLSAIQAGGWDWDSGNAIILNEENNAYITGYFNATAFFDPFPLIGNMDSDIFLAKKNINNSWEWAISAGGGGFDHGYGITLDDNENIYLAGDFKFTATFGQFELSSNGQSDIFVAKLSNPVSVENELSKPIISLSNYPNPFNPKTTITFNLPEGSKIILDIYNIKGQKIKQLVGDHLSAGQHFVVWNGTDQTNKSVSSGIYFYKLKSGDFEQSRKILLLK